ncbi:MAG: hypothetical protein F4X60_03135 [Gemmatimonadetes bacterium]|nr:hypothetical protein [Gemmatimonadota bacterium]MYB97538.1 hypothetical protein [Gemmatimonadota bacterium]
MTQSGLPPGHPFPAPTCPTTGRNRSRTRWQVPNRPHRRPGLAAYFLLLIPFAACQDPVPPNQAPVSTTPIPDQEFLRGDRVQISMSPHFSDPDGDPLTYTATSSNTEVAALSVSGATVTVAADAQGTATATVTATDPGGLSASQNFQVTIPNRSPEVTAPITLVRIGTGEPVTLDMSLYFTDPDGDPLAYTAASSDSAVVRLSVSDAAVEVMPVSLGTASATITATDPGGLSVSQMFTVTVVPSERDALAALYNATNGDNWADNTNWMTDRPLGQWFGVEVSAGQVILVDLWENNLSGTIPPEIGNLGGLERLELGNNRIEGEIPPEIGNLTELYYLSLGLNNLTGEIPPEIGNLTGLRQLRLFSNDLSGSIPPEIGNLTQLWSIWASFNEFTGPLPPEIGKLANLNSVWLYWNRIEGPLPAELGDAANLRDLRLELNEISGPLPPELGKLDKLERLELSVNRLNGPIPPEFGNLSSLRTLAIHSYENRLTGELPAELGRLNNLVELILPGNELTGEIPPEFGNLRALENMTLDGNRLIGGLPPELGDLANLRILQLAGNELSGPVPPGFGGLAELRQLTVSNNPAMAGELSGELTDLSNLNTLATGGTELCAPRDSDFQVWLRGVQKRRVRTCGVSGNVYLTQPVQSRDYPVPLVAGMKALIRVFLTASGTNDEDIPGALARFYADGSEIHSQRLAGKAGPIPTEVLEGDLSKSLNAEVGPDVIRSGLEVVIEVDPVDAEFGVPARIPATGRLQVEVYPVSLFDVMAIPFLWTPDPDSSIIGTVAELAEDPEGHDLLRETRDLLPVNALDVTAHDPVSTSSNYPITLLMQAEAIRVAEGGSEYYMGTMSGVGGGIAGVGFVPGKSTFSIPDAKVIAHEFGHNLSLLHAPCRVDGDPAYPYAGGRIGAWGWDGSQLIEPGARDLMGYCRPNWISDFHFTNALRYRASVGDTIAEMSRSPVRSLLVWGGIGEDGQLFLEPAFALDAPPSLPRGVGDHRLVGRDGDGRELFSLSFEMPVMADGEGAAAFVFALPVQEEWERLASITLSDSGDSVTLDGDSERAMAILRDRMTGQVVAILDDLHPRTRTRADAMALLSPGPDFILRFSRGIPDREAWR